MADECSPLNELGEFHRFLGEKVLLTGFSLSPEQALEEWRNLHPIPFAADDEIAALQEAIDDIEKGDAGIPFEEFDKEFRARRNLSGKS